MQHQSDTIAAICTPPGVGALGMIRISGPDAIGIADSVFPTKELSNAKGNTLHYGTIRKEDQVLDEVVVSLYRGPHSFTKEDTIEISCHGSPYILRSVLTLLVEKGVRLAKEGEFTQRAFLNGGMDLAQAEAVADLIASQSKESHQLALNQLRGGISNELSLLREQLLNFTSLIELELDFGEEDVEFADRTQLLDLITHMRVRLQGLIDSFQLGNAIKRGVPTAIIGKPNAGKSTLLNALLKENRAIVSDIPGTTRDVIEDRVVIDGIEFRLMDTAGVRDTSDVIEAEGVRRSVEAAQTASLVIYVFDIEQDNEVAAENYIESLELPGSTHVIYVGNKIDLWDRDRILFRPTQNRTYLSAKSGENLGHLPQMMVNYVRSLGQASGSNQTIISNVRHLHALQETLAALSDVDTGLSDGLSGDLLSIDIRTALHSLGTITGEITTDEVLGNIFSKFCIGK